MFGSVTTRAVVAMIWGLIASCVIAKIETIIKQNQIQNLMDPLQTGQLIPLIIGGLMFSIVTYEVVLHGKRQKVCAGSLWVEGMSVLMRFRLSGCNLLLRRWRRVIRRRMRRVGWCGVLDGVGVSGDLEYHGYGYQESLWHVE